MKCSKHKVQTFLIVLKIMMYIPNDKQEQSVMNSSVYFDFFSVFADRRSAAAGSSRQVRTQHPYNRLPWLHNKDTTVEQHLHKLLDVTVAFFSS